ncbi:MAG: hypothetical protein AB4038_16500 [Prochloraceae cyanobacterium]
MSKSNLLKNTEYIFIGASAVATIAVVAAAEISIPLVATFLTGSLVLNILNRQKGDKDSRKDAIQELADVEQRLLNKIQQFEDSFQALPPPIEPAELNKLSERIKGNQEAIGTIEQRFSSLDSLNALLPEIQNHLDRLQEKAQENTVAIQETQENIQSLPTRTDLELQTEETFKILQSKQKMSEEEIAKVTEQINSVSLRLDNLFSPPEILTLNSIEQTISELKEQIERLNQQFNDRLEVGEIESLKTNLESPITGSDLNIFTEDLKAVKQQAQNLQATIEELQKAYGELPSTQEIQNIKQRLYQFETIATSETADFSLPPELAELSDIREEIADLRNQLSQIQQLLNQIEEEQETDASTSDSRNLFGWLRDRF